MTGPPLSDSLATLPSSFRRRDPPRGRRPGVWTHLHSAGAVEPGQATVGEGGPVVGLPPGHQPALSDLIRVADLIPVLVGHAGADDVRDLVVQRLEAEDVLARAARRRRRCRSTCRRGVGAGGAAAGAQRQVTTANLRRGVAAPVLPDRGGAGNVRADLILLGAGHFELHVIVDVVGPELSSSSLRRSDQTTSRSEMRGALVILVRSLTAWSSLVLIL